jgi:mannosyltransferase
MTMYRGWFRALILLLLTALAIGLRLHRLGSESFWLDEGTSYAVASLSWSEMFRVLVHERANMALYLVILKLWLPFTHSDAGLRLLSVIFAGLSIPAIDALGRRLFQPLAGFFAALLLTLHGFHVRYSQEARAYALLVMLTILATWAFWALLRSERPMRSGSVYVALMVVAVYSQFMALFLMLGHLAMLVAGATRPAWRRAVLAAACVVLLCTPLFWVMARNDLEKISWVSRPGIAHILSFGFEISGRGNLPAGICYAALLAFALWRAMRDREAVWLRRMVILAGFPFALALGISLVGQPMLVPRYLIFLLPPFLLAVACALTSLPSAALRAGAAVVMVLVSVPGVVHAWNEPREAWRDAAAIILTEGRAADALFVYQTLGSRPLGYYLETSGRPVPRLVFPPEARKWQQNIQPDEPDLAALDGEDRIWLVLSRPHNRLRAARSDAIVNRIARTHAVARAWTLDGGMKVVLFERDGRAQQEPPLLRQVPQGALEQR